MNDPRFPYSRRKYAISAPGALALDVREISVSQPDTPALALNNVSLEAPVGVRLALVGPNGAGKSTLLKAIAGLLPLRAGQILIYGLQIGACHYRVAYLPQRDEIDWNFPISLRHLVMTGRYVHLGWLRQPREVDKAKVDDAMAQMGLTDLAGRQIGELSGGQQQRAMLARALAQDADLLLLDEPLNAVDAETRDSIMDTLNTLHRQGKTALVATHDLSRLEADFDGAIYLSEGRRITPPPGALVDSDTSDTGCTQRAKVWIG